MAQPSTVETEKPASRESGLATAEAGGTAGLRWALLARDYGIVVFLAILSLVFAFAAWPSFFTPDNAIAILNAAAVSAMFAVAAALVVYVGHLDLSVVPVAAIGGLVAAALVKADVPTPLAFVGALAAGAACGGINALLVVRFKIPSVVATLATLTGFDGLAKLVTNTQPIYGIDQFAALGSGRLGPIPIKVIVAILLVVLVHLWLRRSRWGLRLGAVGTSAEAARRAGVRPGYYVATAFMLAGAFAALAGVMIAGFLKSAEPVLPISNFFGAITAVALAAGALGGGPGTLLKVGIGAVVVATIRNGMVLLNVPTAWADVVTAALLVAAVVAGMTLNAVIRRQQAVAEIEERTS